MESKVKEGAPSAFYGLHVRGVMTRMPAGPAQGDPAVNALSFVFMVV